MEIDGRSFTKPRSMVDQIYDELAKAISKGNLRPGQLVTEIELQNMFRTSRAPIREAIRLLEANGLLIVDSFKKKYVRPITIDILKDAIPVISCLEGFAAKLAWEKITAEKINVLETINGQMEIAFEQNNFLLCSKLNFSFHSTYVKICQNPVLIKAIRSIMVNAIWLLTTSLYFKESKLIPPSISEHFQIIEAFKTGDSTRVENEVRQHILNILAHLHKSSFLGPDGTFVLPNLPKLSEVL